jgi:hypothetical protein
LTEFALLVDVVQHVEQRVLERQLHQRVCPDGSALRISFSQWPRRTRPRSRRPTGNRLSAGRCAGRGLGLVEVRAARLREHDERAAREAIGVGQLNDDVIEVAGDVAADLRGRQLEKRNERFWSARG